MASHRIPTLRHILRPPLRSPRAPQRRWARVHDVRFHATHNAQERILAKYRSKLEHKAHQEGLGDIAQLKEAYKEKIESLRKSASVPGATAPLTTPPPSPSPSPSSQPQPQPQPQPTKSPWPSPPQPPTPQPTATPPPPPGLKTLNSFLDLQKITPLPAKEIQALWRLRHAPNPQSIHFSLPASTFTALLSTATRHPSFVLPLPRQLTPDQTPAAAPEEATTTQQAAAELHYLQFSHPHEKTTTLLFTSLAEYKLRGEFASPHTTITFHAELAESHDLVLGQGTVVENRGVTVDEARFLVMCMQKFYVVSDEGKGRGELLDMFTRGDGGFKVERLLEEAEKIV